MRKLRARSLAIAAIAALSFPLGALPATADAESPGSDVVSFGSFESSTFAEIQASMLDNNDPDDVADFLSVVAASEAPNLEPFNLDAYADADAQAILTEAAELAAAGERLPVSVNRAGAGSPAPIVGKAISSRYSWEMVDRAQWSECTWHGPIYACEIVSAINFRFVTDPNDVNTATYFTANRVGDTSLASFVLFSDVYLDGGPLFNARAEKRWHPGHGTQWNLHPNNPNNGHTFQAGYTLRTYVDDGGFMEIRWSTAVTSKCGEPVPGAFRCLF